VEKFEKKSGFLGKNWVFWEKIGFFGKKLGFLKKNRDFWKKKKSDLRLHDGLFASVFPSSI
jgi:hypothetical protein